MRALNLEVGCTAPARGKRCGGADSITFEVGVNGINILVYQVLMEICPLTVGGGETSEMPLYGLNVWKTPGEDPKGIRKSWNILFPDFGCQEYKLDGEYSAYASDALVGWAHRHSWKWPWRWRLPDTRRMQQAGGKGLNHNGLSGLRHVELKTWKQNLFQTQT